MFLKIIPATVPMDRDFRITSHCFCPRGKSCSGRPLTQCNMTQAINDHGSTLTADAPLPQTSCLHQGCSKE